VLGTAGAESIAGAAAAGSAGGDGEMKRTSWTSVGGVNLRRRTFRRSLVA
jgi:hypothetical protein